MATPSTRASSSHLILEEEEEEGEVKKEEEEEGKSLDEVVDLLDSLDKFKVFN